MFVDTWPSHLHGGLNYLPQIGKNTIVENVFVICSSRSSLYVYTFSVRQWLFAQNKPYEDMVCKAPLPDINVTSYANAHVPE